jgi:predicted PhzF superfamily epimerase YddE/YHI9
MAKRPKGRARGGGMIDVAVTVLRVFCGERGEEGNPLGVVLDGAAVAADDRQAIARMLGYSETVFVDDAETGRVRIYTPEVELPFAGHPVIGTGWLLKREGHPAEALLTPAGKIPLEHRDERTTFARARAEWSPPFELVERGSPQEVDSLEPSGDWRYDWAWIDEGAGTIRARCFVPEAGIGEDEATGSAAVALCGELRREIEVHQGRGSVIHARPADEPGAPADLIEFGGIVRVN